MMATKPLPPQDVLRQLLDYDPETGKLFWKKRGEEFFSETAGRSPRHAMKIWNTKFSGKEALCAVTPCGHLQGNLFNRRVYAHRVVFKLVYGVDPVAVDHIDGNGCNNRLENLRECDQAENMKNVSRHRDNTSGAIGVNRHKDGRWVASICVNGVREHLVYTDDLERAIAARREAERQHGFHPNHGRR